MYGQEILLLRNFMKKWECEQKKDKWSTYYKIVFTSGITINKAGGGFLNPVPALLNL